MFTLAASCARGAPTRAALALQATDAARANDDSTANGHSHKRLATQTAESALPAASDALPISLLLLMGQSNIEPGHGFVDDLHNDTVRRIHAVNHRAEVCGRQCDQTYVWHPIVGAKEWPGQGCTVGCLTLSQLIQPPKVTAHLSPEMEWGLGITFGPELSLALHVAEADPGRRVRVIRVADPGHPLDPDWGESGFMLHLARAYIHRFWEPEVPADRVGIIWVHGEVDAKDWESSYNKDCPPEVCGIRSPLAQNAAEPLRHGARHGRRNARAAPPPLQRLSHASSVAYAANLGLLIRRIRKSISHIPGEALGPNRSHRVVMVEPWFGNSLQCDATDLARDNHRRLMLGVSQQHWRNFTLLHVDDELRRESEATAGPDTPMYVQRYCAWPRKQCERVFRCSYGQGHFDTRGLMKLGQLLAAWHLKQGWCERCD